MHIEDKDFALDEGLLPKHLAKGKIRVQFSKLAELAEIPEKVYQDILSKMMSKSDVVFKMITASFLSYTTKKHYWQSYNARLKQFLKS